jgi:hypothetical protein
VCEYATEFYQNVVHDAVFKKNWIIPEWCNQTFKKTFTSYSIDLKTIQTYCRYHDCGKPYCYIDGHFPNHAQVSYDTWMEEIGDEQVGRFILNDMNLHTMTCAQLDSVNLEKHEWLVLIIVGLSEIHSNAEMFGGTDSVNFKIKIKKFNKNVKHVLKKYFNI